MALEQGELPDLDAPAEPGAEPAEPDQLPDFEEQEPTPTEPGSPAEQPGTPPRPPMGEPALSHGLKTLFEASGVGPEVTSWLATSGCVEVAHLANWVDDRTELREAVLNKTSVSGDTGQLAALNQTSVERSRRSDESRPEACDGVSAERGLRLTPRRLGPERPRESLEVLVQLAVYPVQEDGSRLPLG